MRYALLIYADEAGWDARTDEERRSEYRRYEEFGGWLTERGWLRGGDQLAGYIILEARHLDEVLDFTRRHPLVQAGLPMEIRPLRDAPGEVDTGPRPQPRN